MDAYNEIRMRVLEDGTVSINTDAFEEGEIHVQAEQLIKETVKDLGGERKVVQRKPHKHTHAHVHHNHTQKTGI